MKQRRAQYWKINILKIKVKILNYYVKGKNITYGQTPNCGKPQLCESVNIKLHGFLKSVHYFISHQTLKTFIILPRSCNNKNFKYTNSGNFPYQLKGNDNFYKFKNP